MKIGIVGLGNLGSAIACIAGSNGHHVTAWEYDAAVVDECNREHRNGRFLPGVLFPQTVGATTSLQEAFHGADLVLVTLPSRFIGPVLSPFAASVDRAVPLANMSKGIDASTGRTAFQMLAELFPANPKAMISGPSLANEFVNGVATAVVAASVDPDLFGLIRVALSNDHFAVTNSEDVVGVELGGVLKNIYALGLGMMAKRPEAGLNFTGAFLCQGLTEMTALGVAMGGQAASFQGLSGMGDLVATALSEQSHNRTMGQWVGAGLTLAEIKAKMKVLPEGYFTLEAALQLAPRHGVSLPLASLLQDVLQGRVSLADFFPRFSTILASS